MAATVTSPKPCSSSAVQAAAAGTGRPARLWWQWRPRQQRQRRHDGGSSGATRCQASAKSDVGRMLRDALQQPQQGQNLAFLAAGNYLRSLGIEQQSEITRILDIAMNPNSLYTSRDRKQPTNPYARRLEVEADMTPVVDFLLGQGLSREQVAKAIALHPALLCYSVPDRLAPFFEYLAGPQLEMSAAEAATVVERRPTILGVQVGQLQRMVGFLLEGGSSREEVLELMATSL